MQMTKTVLQKLIAQANQDLDEIDTIYRENDYAQPTASQLEKAMAEALYLNVVAQLAPKKSQRQDIYVAYEAQGLNEMDYGNDTNIDRNNDIITEAYDVLQRLKVVYEDTSFTNMDFNEIMQQAYAGIMFRLQQAGFVQLNETPMSKQEIIKTNTRGFFNDYAGDEDGYTFTDKLQNIEIVD